MQPQKIFRNYLNLTLFLVVAMFATSANADVVVIVSAKSSVSSLTSEQIAKIFLGKVDSFPDDQEAYPIDQAEGSAIKDEFYSKVAHKSPSQLTAYWAKIIFAGDGRLPKPLDGNVAVKKAVANNPNAIGYIDKSVVDNSVRIILEP